MTFANAAVLHLVRWPVNVPIKGLELSRIRKDETRWRRLTTQIVAGYRLSVKRQIAVHVLNFHGIGTYQQRCSVLHSVFMSTLGKAWNSVLQRSMTTWIQLKLSFVAQLLKQQLLKFSKQKPGQSLNAWLLHIVANVTWSLPPEYLFPSTFVWESQKMESHWLWYVWQGIWCI